MWIISILLLIIYWCWLFFMWEMFLSFSIDVYVILLYWKISMNCMHFIFIGYLLMLIYFHVENVPEFQYCFWLFTDVDYFCVVIVLWSHTKVTWNWNKDSTVCSLEYFFIVVYLLVITYNISLQMFINIFTIYLFISLLSLFVMLFCCNEWLKSFCLICYNSILFVSSCTWNILDWYWY